MSLLLRHGLCFRRTLSRSVNRGNVAVGNTLRQTHRAYSYGQRSRVKPNFDVDNYRLVYYFRGISVWTSFRRGHYYKVGLVMLAMSACSFKFYRGDINWILFSLCFSTCVLALVALRFGHFTAENLIGKIYVSNLTGSKELVFSYIDSRGSRGVEFIMPDQIQISDHPNSVCKRFLKRITVNDKQFSFYTGNADVEMFTMMRLLPDLYEKD